MADTPPTEEIPVPTPEQIEAAAQIDQSALQRWFSFGEGDHVILHATRLDMDHLFLGLRLLAFAQGDTLAAFQQFTQGEQAEANSAFQRATGRHAQALANLSAFTSAIMAKAERDG